MWDHYCEKSFDDIFSRAKELEADQLTFRMLYKSGDSNLPQNKWIDEHRYPDEKKEELDNYIKCNGIKLETVSFGAVRYAIQGMSILVDSDCMNQHPSDDVRYLILRPNCKLYTKWNEPGSLLF